MRPVPIPEFVREKPWFSGSQVFAAPDGDLTNPYIPPAECLWYSVLWDGPQGSTPMTMVGVVLVLEDDDLDAIRNGARHVLMGWPGMRPPVFVAPEIITEETT